MVKIKVIRGGCGISYTDEHGVQRHCIKTKEDGEFEYDNAKAERLVRLGFARYVTPTVNDVGQKEDELKSYLSADGLQDMTIEDLKKLANDMGVDVTKCRRKQEFIEVISSVELEDDDEDEMPNLDVADPE